MNALVKNLFREILKTKSRFISILAIIGISTGFFTGVKAASPSMIHTGTEYFREKNLMDIRLLSTVGFDDDDIRCIKELECTEDVMPGYYSDLITNKDMVDIVVKVYSMPALTDTNEQLINDTILTQGRMPQRSGECVIEDYFFGISDYKLGDKIVFISQTNGSPTSDIIKTLEYTIVGVVNSPLHVTYQRGNTNIGDGTVRFFIMIPPEDFCFERYTNVYVTTKGSSGLFPYSEDYKDLISSQKKSYEDLSYEWIRHFNDTTLSDAKNEFENAKKEFQDQKQKTLKELADGEKELADGEKELSQKLAEAEDQLAEAEEELVHGRNELEKGRLDYQTGMELAAKKLADARTQLAEGQEKYTRAKAEYDSGIAQGQIKLEAAERDYNTQYILFYGTTKPQAETKLGILKSAITLCQEAMDKLNEKINEISSSADELLDPDNPVSNKLSELTDQLDEYQEKINDYQLQYDDGISQLSEGEKQLEEAGQKLKSAREEFESQKNDGMLRLSEAKIELDNAQSQLENGKIEYENAMSSGLLKLQEAQEKLSDGEKQLQSGKAELEQKRSEGMLKLKQAREKLADGRAEADFKLSEAENELSDAEDKISQIENAKWYCYTRSDNPGYDGLEEDAQRVDNVAQVFPVFFLLVAALVCLTTMSRMVEERRTEIGTLKALGYSDTAIVSKYFVYAALASVLGSLIGCLFGVATLPFIILDTYKIMYSLPPTQLIIPWDSFFFSAGTGMLCTCLVAAFTCIKELMIRPAMLMRPKAPKPGKRILLEYITPLWKRFNFISKVTARNLFRYKSRFLMTVVGVSGCTALIVGAMGLQDSITVIADRQFKEISVYDEIYALSESETADKKAKLMADFHADPSFSETLLTSQQWTTVSYHSGSESIDLRIIIGENQQQFKKIFTLRDRLTHRPITLDDSGIVINERLSQVTGINAGDDITFKINDEKVTAKVTDITENYAGNYIYMTPSLYKSLSGKEAEYNLVYAQLSEQGQKNESELLNKWISRDDILTISVLQDQLNGILGTLDSLNVIVLVIILCAGLLAVVVLYNLTNINIAERVREIATIKVLGFYDLETANYIYRENIILTLTGAMLGIPLGTIFASFINMSIQMDMVMFPHQIDLSSYLTGVLLTLAFSMFVNFIMYFKMNKISMVESLKSID